MVLPYLHERKVYLNKMKPKEKYFYTVMQDDGDGLLEQQEETSEGVNYMVAINFTK